MATRAWRRALEAALAVKSNKAGCSFRRGMAVLLPGVAGAPRRFGRWSAKECVSDSIAPPHPASYLGHPLPSGEGKAQKILATLSLVRLEVGEWDGVCAPSPGLLPRPPSPTGRGQSSKDLGHALPSEAGKVGEWDGVCAPLTRPRTSATLSHRAACSRQPKADSSLRSE
jgi:hypothetical protein